MKRRSFIQKLAFGSLALNLPSSLLSRNFAPLNILILGGTIFVGPQIVRSCIRSGHNVTLFNRGLSNPALFPDIPLIRGDRHDGPGSYAPLLDKTWDLVIDVWPEKSRLVDEATAALADYTGWYSFISSIAVYNSYQTIGLTEESPIVEPRQDSTLWDYSEEKVVAEKLVTQRFPDNHTILRPGPIKGWRDPATDLLYWLVRLRDNRDILGPGPGTDPLQFIDVKDVGRLAISLSENNVKGVFNCSGPLPEKLTWKDFLETARSHLSSASQIHYPSMEFIREQGVRPFDDLPLWVPLEEDPGFMQISSGKAHESGRFSLSSIESTIDDCLAWYDLNDMEVDCGLGYAREAEVLAAYVQK